MMTSSAVSSVRCCTTCGAVYRAEYPRCVNDGAEIVVLHRDPLVGQAVGPYVVDALIGEGGMGRVYRVHHAHLPQKRYALKVLLGDFAATPTMRKRFAKEARSASQLAHPNVVSVCDFGVTDAGLAYLAMDLVEGTPLSELVTDTPMPPARAIHLARQLCLGLAHAHDLGLIHRDFKPDNILVVDGPGGEVPRIADFGLAISTDETDVRLTTGGVVLGTPAYVAPEQVTSGEVDHRADLYALGVTLFELLSGGHLPFNGDAAEVVGLKAMATAPAIEDLAPDALVPPALAAIVDRLLARRPEDRYPDARAVALALDEIVRNTDIAGLPPAPAEWPRATAEQPPLAAERPRVTAERPAAEPRSGRTARPVVRLATQGKPRTRRDSSMRLERVPDAERARSGVAILAGAIVLAGLIVGGAMWLTRSTGPAIADVPPAAPREVAEAAPRPPRPPAAAEATAAEATDATPGATGATLAARDAGSIAPRRSDRADAPPQAVRAGEAPAPVRSEAHAAAPPAPPAPRAPRLASLDVRGGLPQAAVRRALDRAIAGVRACRSPLAGEAEVRFTIGELRRATDLRASGHPAARCLADALSGIRTDSAPDVGDALVHARFTYGQPR